MFLRFIFHANSAGPDQTPRSAASDLGLHCLSIFEVDFMGHYVYISFVSVVVFLLLLFIICFVYLILSL